MRSIWIEIFLGVGLEVDSKGVNTISEVVPVWPVVRYISDTDQYWYTVSGLLLFYIYIIINIKVYHKTFPQFRTNYSWF